MKKTEDTIAKFLKDNSKWSKETLRSYEISLRQFFTFCDKDYDQVLKVDVSDWVADLGKEKPDRKALKDRSIHLKLAALKSFYNYCIEEGLVEKSPASKIIVSVPQDDLPVYLDRAALAQLQELSVNNMRNRALVQALYDTGCRISELLNIELEEIKWDDQLIEIKHGKGDRARIVLFTVECGERLKEYLAKRNIESPYLFASQRGGHLSRIWAEKLFNRYSKELGLGYKVTPHTMRHTLGAHLAERGLAQEKIAQLFGHKNIMPEKKSMIACNKRGGRYA
jgi:site-specific recombinase XerD